MKRILQLIFLSATFQMANAQQADHLIIDGDLNMVKEQIEQVNLYFGSDYDSCKVVNGKYSFKVKFSKPSTIGIRFMPKSGVNPVKDEMTLKKYQHSFYFEPGVKTITCTDSLFSCKTTGSKTDVVYQSFIREQRVIVKNLEPLIKEVSEHYKKGDTAIAQQLQKKLSKQYDSVLAKFCFNFVLKDPDNPIVFYILKQASGYPFNGARLKPIFEKLPEYVQNSTEGKQFREKIENSLKLGIGKLAPDFTQADTSGRDVRLSSFRGKYVLLDFWGSWCGPCRYESPYMVKAFNKYKEKGFTIIAVAADDSKNKWMDAIHKDGTGGWTHVSDLKGKDNSISKLYSIVGYPTNYLIDPTGKIIAENLRGDDLGKKLDEILKQ